MWIVKKIGRIRSPKEGEYYLTSTGHFQCSTGIVGEPREILSVTPVPNRKVWMKKFEEWHTDHSPLYEGGICPHETIEYATWIAAHDLLFGWKEQEEPYHWVDTFNGW
jgi:hypothetical protein